MKTEKIFLKHALQEGLEKIVLRRISFTVFDRFLSRTIFSSRVITSMQRKIKYLKKYRTYLFFLSQ